LRCEVGILGEMPELPDVEGFKRYLNRYAAGRRIEGVDVLDRKMLRSGSPRGLAGEDLGRARRHGKWLIADAGGATILMHFGMTGLLHWSTRDDRHDHDRIVLRVEGGELRYRNMRRFGAVHIARGEDGVREVIGPLGPDALDVSRDEFHELLGARRRSLKAALMDQTVTAGLGNLLVDEICWRACVRPGTQLARLSRRRRDDVYDCMQAVLHDSIPRGRIPREPGWLTGARDERPGTCPRCGTELKRATIAGRTTCWCPSCQRS
jgi:formamidopyrimidine-DNA glycosylase